MTAILPTKVLRYGVRTTIWSIVMAVGVLLFIMWAAIAAYVVISRHDAIDESVSKGRNLAIAFREELATLIRAVDGEMQLIAMEMRRDPNFDLYAWGQHNVLVSPGVAQASIIGPYGMQKSTTSEANPDPVDLSDRDSFRVHANDKSQDLYFGQTVIGRVSHEPVLPISRRIDAQNGTFLGVLVVLIPLRTLTTLNKSIDLGPHGVLTLSGLDRRLRARFSADSPDNTKGIGVAALGIPPWDAVGENAYGSFVRVGVVDGVTRIFVYSRIGSYPLIVNVGLELDKELAPWRSNTSIVVLLGLFATTVLTGLAVYLSREIRIRGAYETELIHAARHDLLTGLPNRLLLSDRLDQAIALARRHGTTVAVLFLDLDGFKHINDSLGHSVGDKLLQSIAEYLVTCVRRSDTVSRQGGDEFVVLLSEVARSDDAAIVARRLLHALASQDIATTARKMLQVIASVHAIERHEIHVTASIGISVYPDDGLDAETLIKNADTAMYQVKENGRQDYKFFTPAMNVQAVERQSIEANLRSALERHEFELHYQPKVDLITGEITGAEALIRWAHPVRGAIPPAQFIPVAEACGLILPISNWVLREACRQARAWLDAGLPLGTMAVNVSAAEFQDHKFPERVFEILDETGLDARHLELELTESVLMKHAGFAAAIIKRLRRRGVRIAVDDFGTGYSSLSYLRKFQVDALKIDQSFIRQINTEPDETIIVTAVISMGRSLKLRVVAEGVETIEELAFLRAQHCDEAQGYYFSRPVLPERFAKLLETGVTEFGRRGLLAEGAEPGPAARTAAAAAIVQVQGSPVRAVSAPSRDGNPSATREAS